jgi:hypothetical protein
MGECEELERTACSEEFAERVRSWIEAKPQEIANLEGKNEELEMKIAEVAVPLTNVGRHCVVVLHEYLLNTQYILG